MKQEHDKLHIKERMKEQLYLGVSRRLPARPDLVMPLVDMETGVTSTPSSYLNRTEICMTFKTQVTHVSEKSIEEVTRQGVDYLHYCLYAPLLTGMEEIKQEMWREGLSDSKSYEKFVRLIEEMTK